MEITKQEKMEILREQYIEEQKKINKERLNFKREILKKFGSDYFLHQDIDINKIY